jgi:transcriptional regulator with XRE-family HTH domain
VYKKNIIGLRIRIARREAHFTQEKLAADMQLMGITIDRSAIAKIETGKRPVSDIEIAAIAKILKVTITWLFETASDFFK